MNAIWKRNYKLNAGHLEIFPKSTPENVFSTGIQDTV